MVTLASTQGSYRLSNESTRDMYASLEVRKAIHCQCMMIKQEVET